MSKQKPKTTEIDGGPVIFVNQPEVTDGWTADEVIDFRDWLARMIPVWQQILVANDDRNPAPPDGD